MSSIDVESLPACTECGRRMRPRAVKAGDSRTGVAPGARGLCATCYKRQTRPLPPLRGDGTLDTGALPACTECGLPMRPKGASLREWPGTVVDDRSDDGRCATCRRRATHAAQTERLRAIARRRAQEQQAAAARARARAERDRRKRIAALANQLKIADHTVVTVDGAGRMAATLTVTLGRYDGSTTTHHQAVARAMGAFAGALARRCLRPVTSPAPVINRPRGEVVVSATVVPTARAREATR